MNKKDYLDRLELLLRKKLDKPEAQDILSDYREFFEDGRRQGMTDTEIIIKLGSPDLVAEQVLLEFEGPCDTADHPDRLTGATDALKAAGKGAGEVFGLVKRPFSFLLRVIKSVLRVGVLVAICGAVLFALCLVLFAAGALFFFAVLLLITSFLALGLLPSAVVLTGVFGGLFVLCLALLSSLVLYAAAKYSFFTAQRVYFHEKEVLSNAA